MFIISTCSIFFWVKDSTTADTSSHFDWRRDSIYIATLLLGSGGAIVVVIALSMVAFLVQDYKVSIFCINLLNCRLCHQLRPASIRIRCLIADIRWSLTENYQWDVDLRKTSTQVDWEGQCLMSQNESVAMMAAAGLILLGCGYIHTGFSLRLITIIFCVVLRWGRSILYVYKPC